MSITYENPKNNLKKIIHNSIERKRKNRIIQLIDKIIELLPYQSNLGLKTNRTSRLEQIYTYIIDLRNKNDALMFANPNSVYVQEILSLKKYIEKLETSNKNYRQLLKTAGISPNCPIEEVAISWKSKPLKYSSINKQSTTGKYVKVLQSDNSETENESDSDSEIQSSDEKSVNENKTKRKDLLKSLELKNSSTQVNETSRLVLNSSNQSVVQLTQTPNLTANNSGFPSNVPLIPLNGSNDSIGLTPQLFLLTGSGSSQLIPILTSNGGITQAPFVNTVPLSSLNVVNNSSMKISSNLNQTTIAVNPVNCSSSIKNDQLPLKKSKKKKKQKQIQLTTTIEKSTDNFVDTETKNINTKESKTVSPSGKNILTRDTDSIENNLPSGKKIKISNKNNDNHDISKKDTKISHNTEDNHDILVDSRKNEKPKDFPNEDIGVSDKNKSQVIELKELITSKFKPEEEDEVNRSKTSIENRYSTDALLLEKPSMSSISKSPVKDSPVVNSQVHSTTKSHHNSSYSTESLLQTNSSNVTVGQCNNQSENNSGIGPKQNSLSEIYSEPPQESDPKTRIKPNSSHIGHKQLNYPSEPATTSISISSTYSNRHSVACSNSRFTSIKDSLVNNEGENITNKEANSHTLVSNGNVSNSKQRNEIQSGQFEMLDSNYSANIFNETSVGTNQNDNRVHSATCSNLESGGISGQSISTTKSSFEFSSFANQSFMGSSAVNSSTSTTSFFNPTGQTMDSSSYSNGMFFSTNPHSHHHQAPFPTILSSAATPFEANVFNSSPHKSSSHSSMPMSAPGTVSSVFNANFMPEFSTSSFNNSVVNSVTDTTTGSNNDTDNPPSSGYSRKTSNNSRKKSTSVVSNSAVSTPKVTSGGGRKTQSKKSTPLANGSSGANANTTGSINHVEAKYSSENGPGNSFTSNVRRSANENHFLIPDIISPAGGTTSSTSTVSNLPLQSTAYSQHDSSMSVSSNLSVDHIHSNHNAHHQFSNRYSFFASSSDQTSCNTNTNPNVRGPESHVNNSHTSLDSNDLGQNIIGSSYPIIFRPQNSSSDTVTSSSANSSSVSIGRVHTVASTSSVPSSYFSKSNLNYNPAVNVTSLYHPPSTGHGGSNHVPNFNLSNIFPDITLTTPTSVTIPVNSYPYIAASNVEVAGTSTTSAASSTKHHLNASYTRFNPANTFGSGSQTSSNTNQAPGFLPKFSHILSKSPVVGVVGDSFSVAGGTVDKTPTMTPFYGAHSHHHNQNSRSHHANYAGPHHFYPPPPPQHNFGTSANHGHYGATVSTSTGIRHATSGNTSHFSNSAICDDLGGNGGGVAGTGHRSAPTNCSSSITSSISTNYNMITHTTQANSMNSGAATQSSLQSFSFPYRPPAIQSGTSSGQDGIDVRMGSVDSNLATSLNSSNTPTFNAHHVHHQQTPPATLGTTFSRGRNNSSSIQNTAPPPPPHIPFSFFNLSRTDL